jgi:hypothetical protein
MANSEHVGKAYQEFIDSVFPFMKGERKDEDKKMLDRMAKEVAKGPISFKTVDVRSVFQPPTPLSEMPKSIADILRKGKSARVIEP